MKYNVLLFIMLFSYQVISPSQHQHPIATAALSSSNSSCQSRPNPLQDRLCQLLFSFRQHDSGTTDQEPLTPRSQMIFDSVKKSEDENRKHKEDKLDLKEKLCELQRKSAHFQELYLEATDERIRFQELYQDAIDDREAEIKRRTESSTRNITALWQRYINEADQLKKEIDQLEKDKKALQKNLDTFRLQRSALPQASLTNQGPYPTSKQ